MNLSCSDLTMRWTVPGAGDKTVFDTLDALFPEGTASLIVGPTGGGKSTLLHLLGGLLRPTAGMVMADDAPVSRWPSSLRDRWRRQVGICFQQLHLPMGLTALDAVIQPLIPRRMPWATIIRDASAAIDALDLTSVANSPIRWLSGGQQQRVAMARAVVHSPLALLLDEPTAFQDDTQVSAMTALLADQVKRGACVVVSSHDERLATASVFGARYRLHNQRLETLP